MRKRGREEETRELREREVREDETREIREVKPMLKTLVMAVRCSSGTRCATHTADDPGGK